MEEIWQRIKDWLNINYPEGLTHLNEGASEALLNETEALLNVRLPEDLRDFYRIHNGTKSDFGLLDGLLSLEQIQGEWQTWKELLDKGKFNSSRSFPDSGIRADWWNSKWIPFTHDGAGNNYCLDMNPAESGKVGQIITMWHDSAERELIAESFREFVEGYIDELEAGEYVYSPDEYDAIVRIDDISEEEQKRVSIFLNEIKNQR